MRRIDPDDVAIGAFVGVETVENDEAVVGWSVLGFRAEVGVDAGVGSEGGADEIGLIGVDGDVRLRCSGSSRAA